MNPELDIAVERLQTRSRLFAYSRWDALPVLAGIIHCLFFFGMFWLFGRVPIWVMLVLGLIYSISISWTSTGFLTTSFIFRISDPIC